ncbi:hypothetical protein GGI20_002770 [Coemansia sp. BCRC 34301]|nr:hypothetical protein GGI20_002770 [Coemansia sp. BCRC 34301]
MPEKGRLHEHGHGGGRSSGCCTHHTHEHGHNHAQSTDPRRSKGLAHTHKPFCGGAQVSWRRLWLVLLKDHGFLGARLYTSIAHLAVGVCVWATGICTGSLALMSYSFLVLFDAWSLLVGTMPTVLEYSHNDSSSIEYAFGLQILSTLLEFVNSITLLYRAVQALKEGIEHIATSGHHSHSSTVEFETYAHASQGHNQDAVLGLLSVTLAMLVTGYSAAQFANHHALWEACSRQRQDIGTRLQNVLLNPYNLASLFAGAWMSTMIILAPPKEESVIEPVSCVLMAAVMAYVSLPTCVHLGRVLLHGSTRASNAGARAAVWQISRLPGVVDCSRLHVWSTALDKHAVALRVMASPARCDSTSLQRHISGILASSGLSDWTVEIRKI